jgi:hypothetical protein
MVPVARSTVTLSTVSVDRVLVPMKSIVITRLEIETSRWLKP